MEPSALHVAPVTLPHSGSQAGRVAGKQPCQCMGRPGRQAPASLFVPECQSLSQSLLQLKPGARLGLQQVATHCWMVPATLAIFQQALNAMRRPPERSPALEKPSAQGESGGSVSLLPDLESSAKPPEGTAKGTKAPAGPRTSSAQDAFPARAEMEAKAPELISAGCLHQLPSPCQAERSPRFSLYRPSLLSGLWPFHHLPNFRKPSSATPASAHVASRRLGEKRPAVAAALGSGSSKPSSPSTPFP